MRDIDIRRELRVEMERLHHGEPDTLVVEELGLCQGVARIDLAVVNGSVHGYEIKSEQDTLVRLPNQTGVYNRALDFVTIVAAPTHIAGVVKVIPSWWGVWSAIQDDGGLRLEKSRNAMRNPNIDPYALAQLLWRDEALQALTDRGMASGMRSKSRPRIWRRLAADLTVEELGALVRDCLKRRGAAWRSPAPVA